MRAVTDAIYDFDEQQVVKTSYVVCSNPRSGSTLLCNGLWDTGVAGAPLEYFHQIKHMPDYYNRWQPKDFNDYLSFLFRFRTSPNGVFGFKAHFDQFKFLNRNVRLQEAFAGLKYIRIQRKDQLRQAISFSKASQTRKWASSTASDITPAYSYTDILAKLKIIINSELSWNAYFEAMDITPFNIIYEEFAAAYDHTILKVLQYLDLQIMQDFVIPEPKMKRQSDGINEEWLARFMDDHNREKEKAVLTAG